MGEQVLDKLTRKMQLYVSYRYRISLDDIKAISQYNNVILSPASRPHYLVTGHPNCDRNTMDPLLKIAISIVIQKNNLIIFISVLKKIIKICPGSLLNVFIAFRCGLDLCNVTIWPGGEL